MQLERKYKPIVEDNKKRKMVNIKLETHTRIAQLAYETGYSITDLTDMLLCDALSRVELVGGESRDRCWDTTSQTIVPDHQEKSSIDITDTMIVGG